MIAKRACFVEQQIIICVARRHIHIRRPVNVVLGEQMDKIICIGKNYPAHAAELGDVQPEQPVLFFKPPSCLRELGAYKPLDAIETLQIPSGDIHHELEIVFRLEYADSSKSTFKFSAFTLGLDLTRRDLQSNLKKGGHPWEIAKVFKDSAVIAPWLDGREWPTYSHQPFQLLINGKPKQVGKAPDMLWPPEACIALAAQYFPVLSGDLLFTGTPVGVGPLKSGDLLELRWGDTPMGAKLRIE